MYTTATKICTDDCSARVWNKPFRPAPHCIMRHQFQARSHWWLEAKIANAGIESACARDAASENEGGPSASPPTNCPHRSALALWAGRCRHGRFERGGGEPRSNRWGRRPRMGGAAPVSAVDGGEPLEHRACPLPGLKRFLS